MMDHIFAIVVGVYSAALIFVVVSFAVERIFDIVEYRSLYKKKNKAK